jgi:FeS assembly SUF system protein
MTSDLKTRIDDVLRTIYDPEIPVNIYDVGLIYDVKITDEADVHIVMTLTSPMCPVAESLPPEVEIKLKQIEGVRSATVEITWDPPWDPSMMSEAAQLELGMF